ncbi:MAG: EamA family transporter [Cellvibrionaceae bacterium]|nr:EamA family transporter [Cellvibrionaceae bacterium]|tara:strand:+ start:195604 stop:196500 length:897 start_codon:yes stop_codon:yes gene_type:complete
MADSAQKGILFVLATALVGSTAAAAGKLASQDLDTPMIVFVQYAICLMVMVPRFAKQGISSLKTQRLKTHLIRGAGGWISFFAFYSALADIPLVDANLLRNTAPLFVPLIVFLWSSTLVPRNRWIPLILGFVGVAIILRPDTGGEGFNYAYLVGLSSGALLAVSMVGTRLLSHSESSGTIMFYYFALSFVLSTPFAIANWQTIPLQSWPYLIYIGVSIFIAMWLYTKAYSYAKPSLVSPISYFSVVFSGLIGWLIWGHVPTLLSVAGMGIVICAGICTVYLGNGDQQATAPPSSNTKG